MSKEKLQKIKDILVEENRPLTTEEIVVRLMNKLEIPSIGNCLHTGREYETKPMLKREVSSLISGEKGRRFGIISGGQRQDKRYKTRRNTYFYKEIEEMLYTESDVRKAFREGKTGNITEDSFIDTIKKK